MSNKYSRHQSIINREADSHIDEDHWLKQFEKNLQKSAVQSRRVDQSLFEQINGIMNNKSKYTSVSHAVEDMMQRSGLTKHLKNINKLSQEKNIQTKKASDANDDAIVTALLNKAKSALKKDDSDKWHTLGECIGKVDLIKNDIKSALNSIKDLQNSKDETFSELKIPFEHWDSYANGYAKGAKLSEEAAKSSKESVKKISNDLKLASEHHDFFKKKTEIVLPLIFEKVPSILKTLENYIQDTKGNLPVPAILEKVKSIHSKDVADPREWDDEKLLAWISNEKLKQQSNNPVDNYHNLGFQDTSISEVNDSNTDMFSSLMPAPSIK